VGTVIDLAERRMERIRPARRSVAFFFALGDPISYLAAEQVERALGEVDWVPVLWPSAWDPRARLAVAAREAGRLRLALVEPPLHDADLRPISRAARLASEHGAGSRFALAAFRLVFCGGFALDDPETCTEAALCAGVDLQATLEAMADPAGDTALMRSARALRRRGVRDCPALRVGERFLEGLGPLSGLAGGSAVPVGFEGPPAPAPVG
jgi:2-hydroxychromene-2-carboxylate isomerase